MESAMGAEALQAWDEDVGGCWAPAGIGDDIAEGTQTGSRAAAPRHESGRTAFPCRLRPMCARDRWR